MSDKRGFTLVEVIVTLALIALVTAAFMQVAIASTRLAATGRAHSEASSALAAAIEGKALPAGAARRSTGAQVLHLSNDNAGEAGDARPDSSAITIVLEETELYYPGDAAKGVLYYYQ